MMKTWFLAGVSVLAFGLASSANAGDLPDARWATKAPPAADWTWTGLYVGAHVGGAWNATDFSDPFGSPIFGDRVRSPGFFGGGQIGYNWQAPGSWVFGVEADISGLSSDGTNTCYGVSLQAVDTTCRVSPQVAGTFTGRIGYAVGPAGRTLVYGKGGVGWVYDKVEMALNSGDSGPAIASSQHVTLWGATLGVGVEQALTPAWSLKLEYDYLGLGGSNVANLGSANVSGTGVVLGTTPAGTSGIRQNTQEVKLGLNYRWGADPMAPGWNAAPLLADPFKARSLSPANGWDVEAGGRYFGSWGQYKKDIGFFTTSGVSSVKSISRLTYDDMTTNSGEVFGRVEAPSNLFVKGFIGAGRTRNGHMNDEDFMIYPSAPDSYSNTLAAVVTGKIGYGAIDGGFDLLRGSGSKVGIFAGYFQLNQDMSAYGCNSIVNNICVPAISTSGAPNITETDRWRAVRVGIAAETMLTDRVKISGDMAYLPYVKFTGVDQHLFGNSGQLASNNPESATGRGVQLEVLVSYDVTPQWSVGLGGRYWGLWTTNGQVIRDFDSGTIPPAPTSPAQFFKAQVEQAGAFLQTSYKFSTN
jgi:opacity protein-like surface antigen